MSEVLSRCPVLRPGCTVGSAVDETASNLDVDGVLQALAAGLAVGETTTTIVAASVQLSALAVEVNAPEPSGRFRSAVFYQCLQGLTASSMGDRHTRHHTTRT